MNPNKIKQLAEKMGKPKPTQIINGIPHWKTGPVAGNEWLYGFNPESSDADMVELLQTLMLDVSVTIQRRDPRMNVPKPFIAGNEQLAIVCQGETLRAAVVSFSCRVWGIEE